MSIGPIISCSCMHAVSGCRAGAWQRGQASTPRSNLEPTRQPMECQACQASGRGLLAAQRTGGGTRRRPRPSSWRLPTSCCRRYPSAPHTGPALTLLLLGCHMRDLWGPTCTEAEVGLHSCDDSARCSRRRRRTYSRLRRGSASRKRWTHRCAGSMSRACLGPNHPLGFHVAKLELVHGQY